MGYQGRMVSFEPNPAESQNVVALASGDPDGRLGTLHDDDAVFGTGHGVPIAR